MMNSLFPLPSNEKTPHDLNKVQTYPVNLYHKSEYDVFIGRGSKWGNPWSHLKSEYPVNLVNTREEALIEYYKGLINNPDLMQEIPQLTGNKLGCYCYPSFCHGDILGIIADSIKTGENILENNIYKNVLTITEKQYEILDDRRLELLAILTNTEGVYIKNNGKIIGYQLKSKNASEVSIEIKKDFLGEGIYMFHPNEMKENFSKLNVETHDLIRIESFGWHLPVLVKECIHLKDFALAKS